MTDAAAEKLRTVLDYVPCEACLAQPVDHQELLCSICRRLDREVGVRVAFRTTVLVERPSEPAAAGPVVIPPAPPAEPTAAAGAVVPPAAPPVEVRFVEAGELLPKPAKADAPAVEVFVEPYADPVAAPVVAPEPDVEWEDVASFTPPSDDVFDYTPGPVAARPAAPPPQPILLPEEPAEAGQDDFVFRPPPATEAPAARREEEPDEEWMPTDEVRVVPEDAPLDAESAWAPPRDEPRPAEPEPVAQPEAEPVETLPVEDVVEMQVVEDEPAPEPASGSDLWKLRGFDASAEAALGGASVRALSHLSGHDAGELSSRTGLPASRLASWIDVADLVHEVGVPPESAVALVAAGVAGPKGLRAADPDDVVEKVSALGGGEVRLSDVKRWKRRA